jgi:polyhydroxybutyrate depolymerase
MRRATLAVVVGLLVTAAAARAEVVTWKVDGETREAIVMAPARPPAGTKVPVVLSFHGHGDDMQNFQYTNVHRAWPDAVVLYFQGLPSRDGYRGWQVVKGEYNDRDLKLVDAALAWAHATYTVDDDRVYATGFSNGAMFTYLLWAERPAVFAAYGPVAGRIRDGVRISQPRPLIHVAGMRDQQVAFVDQDAAIKTALTVNGAGTTSTSCGRGCTTYGAATATPVVAWIHPGGHEYPDGTTERIVAFFHDHPRRH